MFNTLARCALFSLLLLGSAEAAEPVKLKLAYFSSDREQAYVNAIKPFVDAVNAKAKGVIEIQVYPSGALGREFAQQAQMVLERETGFEGFPMHEVITVTAISRFGWPHFQERESGTCLIYGRIRC